MIRTITVKSEDRSKTFDLFKPEATGFLVYKIDGIGPGEIDINTSERPYDGDYFNSARKSKRTISIYIKPIWISSKTIEQLRNEMYKYFPFKKELTLIFTTDSRIGSISGYVSNISPEIFSAAETFQIDIVCPEPFFSKYPSSTADFYTYDELSHFKLITAQSFAFNGTGVNQSFPIPDEAFVMDGDNYDSYQEIYTPENVTEVRINGTPINPSEYVYIRETRSVIFNTIIPTSEDLIEVDITKPGNPVSSRNYNLHKVINYTGEVDTGVLIRVIFFKKYTNTFWVGKSDDNEWINVSLKNSRLNALLKTVLPREFPSIVFDPSVDYYIKPRDAIIIDTNPGKKGIYLRREIAGKEYFLSLANCVYDSTVRPFKWWSIGLGDNDITIGSPSNDILNYANVAIDYADKFAGL